MDAAGARALARRIEEQQASEERDTLTTRAAAPAVAKPSSPAARRKTPPPAISSSHDSSHSVPPARDKSEGRRDIRRYTTDVRREDTGEGPTVTTTIRCHSLVDGHWESRIVEVRVESV
jgi:hypothetical protein